MRRALGICLAALFCGSATAPLRAGHVEFSVDGIITAADPGNPFGLNLGDPWTMSGRYRLSDYHGGTGDVPFGAVTGNEFAMYLGAITLKNSHDDFYFDPSGDLPDLTFEHGQLKFMDFEAIAGFNDAPVSASTAFSFTALTAGDPGSRITATWLVTRSQVVPEPSSLAMLAGVVLAGTAISLVRARRRRGIPAFGR